MGCPGDGGGGGRLVAAGKGQGWGTTSLQEEMGGSVRHGPGWPMGPWAGLGYGLGRASNLGISTGSGRARAESSIQITILFYTIKLIIHDKSSFLIHEQRSCKVNQPAFEVQTAE